MIDMLRKASAGLLTVMALAVAGCTSEKVVYKTGTDFAAPPSTAASFIGYFDETNKQTVCGSCHIDFQVRWKTTKHASAWADLQASGAAAGYCNACHTVGAYGNAATDTLVGFTGSKDARYHDVQCESCHGAGLTHASGPNSSNHPLASIKADTTIKNGCGECHSGVHDPFVTEWQLSNFSGLSHSHIQSGASSNTDPTCKGCHSAQGALLAFGVTDNYAEKNDATWQPIVCATCHDPHGSDNDHQLRFSIRAPNIDNNLCMRCHQRRSDPSTVTTRNSVHSPQGPTLLGVAGWFPPGMNTSDSIYGTHASTAKNPTLCAGCHVSRYTATDKATGKFVFQSTGHRFIAAPCVDANGQPTVDQSCTTTGMTFRACVNSGCHGSETAARSSYNTANARITTLINSLNTYITQAKAGPLKAECTFPTANKVYTTCNGASFNVSLAQSPASFVHNPFLIEQLLIGTINQMKKDYSLTASAQEAPLAPMFKKGVIVTEQPH